MENGCVCLYNSLEPILELSSLALQKEIDSIVVFSDDTVEPLKMAESLQFELPGGESSEEAALGEISKLDTCVTVLDINTFEKSFEN